MATSVRRKLRNSKQFALPSVLRNPATPAPAHWLENFESSVRKLSRAYAGRCDNANRFPDAVVKLLKGNADIQTVADEFQITVKALLRVHDVVKAELYQTFGKDQASTPANVLALVHRNADNAPSLRRLKSAKHKASEGSKTLVGTLNKLHGKLLKTQNDLRDQKDAMEQRISELEQENASLKEQLEAARRNGAPVAAANEMDEGMEVAEAPGPPNNVADQVAARTTANIFELLQSELNGSFGQPAKYVHEATIVDGSGGLLTRMREKTDPVACKRFEMPDTDEEVEVLLFEVGVMKDHGHHANIVGLLEVFYTDLHVYVIMPYMQAGSHADVIKNARLLGKRLSAAMAAHVIKQVLTGIDYLHWHNIVHRDIKPENIFVDHLAVVMLGDFGWAARSVNRQTVGGTVDYMAPEVVVAWPGRNTEQPYTAVVDEWSVGMVFYDVVHGDSPFLVDKQAPSDANDPDETANQRWEKVRDDICNTDALVGRMIRALGGFSGALRDFIGLMLKADPADRQTAEQLLEHAFLDNPDEDGWKQVVQLSMGNVAKVDFNDFREAYEQSKFLRFRFRDAEAAFYNYKLHFALEKLQGRRAQTPKNYLAAMQKLFTKASGTQELSTRVEYLHDGWRGALRHKDGKKFNANYAKLYPHFCEIIEYEYVGTAPA